MSKIRVFEAFAGYGSQAMALERLKSDFPMFDFEIIGISEIDQYAITAYMAVHGETKNYGDISKIDWKEVPDFDFLTYSFPCQDISSAGNQKGLEEGSGTRSSLLWECRKAIESKKPKYLLMENVKALTQKKFLPFLKKWGGYLESLGYSNFTKVLNAKEYGVPQNRERVFMVSILGAESFGFPKPFELNTRLKDVLETDVEEKYYLSKKCIDGFSKHNEHHNEKGTGFLWKPKSGEDIANCIRANAALAPTDNTVEVEMMNTDKNGNASCIKAGYYKMGRANFIGHPKDGFKATCVKEIYGNKRVQRLVDSGKLENDDIQYIDAYNQQVKEDVVNTIKTTIDTSCMTFVKEPLVEQYRIRKLTPRECFRLMGVSEEDIDKIQSAGISNSQQYKMAGNSIVVDVLYYIFKSLFIEREKGEAKQLTLF